MTKAIIDRIELAKALPKLKKCLPKGCMKTLYGDSIRVNARPGSVTFTATDGDVSLSICFDSDAGDTFETGVSLADVQGFAKGATGERIELTRNDGSVGITDGNASTLIEAKDLSRALIGPRLGDNLGGNEWAGFERIEARQSIEFVSLAASKDETRYNLCGIYVDAECTDGARPDSLRRFVATDGRRLHSDEAYCIPLYGGGYQLDSHIVPLGAVNALLAMLPKGARGEKGFEWGPSGLTETNCTHAIRGNGWVIAYAAIDGEYPNWRQVVPNTEAGRVGLEADDMTRICKQVESAAERGKPPFAKFTLEAYGDQLLVDGKAGLSGRIAASGHPFVAGFDARYLRDAMAGFKGKGVTIRLPDEGVRVVETLRSPIRVGHGNERFAVVMPYRL